MEGFEGRHLFFIYGGARLGVRPAKRRDLKPPYSGAPEIQCNVYYWWWEYLRRHSGYKRTCEQGGRGKCSKLYRDFGDVHAPEFWEWWRQHNYLFAEPKPRQVEEADRVSDDPMTLTVQIPLENKQSLSMQQIKRLLEPRLRASKQRKTESRALYPVATKPVLPSIYMHLKVWDAKQANPAATDIEIADIAEVPVNRLVDGMTERFVKEGTAGYDKYHRVIRRRKQLAVQRHLRIAEQYIENVGKGYFPLRTSR
jgi:hypothetical protein